ncbi:MAG: HK97 family phage prohead protease, partial [Emcibacteraceae bacterium]|nr:HK97 family phage prohead protease [Emcibacteraceae bacterium]
MTDKKINRTLAGTLIRSGDKTTFEASLSSEHPFDRGYYTEILDHGIDAVDMERAKDGLPLLLDHDGKNVIGRVSGIHINSRKLRGTIRFGKSVLAKEVSEDVQAEIRKEISIGYSILETESDNQEDDVVRVTKWLPHEISIVGVPADHTVGIGRSKTFNK